MKITSSDKEKLPLFLTTLQQESVLSGQETLKEEAAALLVTADRLGKSFSVAIEILLEAYGKTVVTGLGKSGHVARKIAATLSSCGTPSIYLHPGEALHGDLGLLEKNDVLLALAYSGETYETVKVARYAKNTGLRVISITGNLDSALAKLSDASLHGGVSKEVCPNALAPTSSTTVAMALGDALAVSLMKAKNFTAKDFARYHPEGLLGRKLSLVSEFTRKDSSPVTEDSSLQIVIHHMSSPNYGVTAVIEKTTNIVTGVITDGDLRRFLLNRKIFEQEITAFHILTRNPRVITEYESAYNAGKLMEDLGISSLVVVDQEKKYTGILKLGDLIRAKIL
jgi:arabinose-5-phosphate isomerase